MEAEGTIPCPSCDHPNRPGRYCAECGAHLGVPCAACGTRNTPGERFCGHCSASLTAAGAAEARAPLSRLTPNDNRERASAHDGERRQLTVLFCDLVGSTELASQMDPEDWRDVVHGYQQSAAEEVTRFGGHVAQLLGDGLLAYFGWPQAYGDDAERAVRAGLGLVGVVGSLDRRLAVRVGIHTGLVVVGALGGGNRTETLAVGDTPNIAARLQAVATPDTVVVSSAALRLVRGIFVTEELGPQRLKGISEPLYAYRVLQPSGMRSRLDVAAGRLTPFVGRDVELGMLLDRWERAQEGHGQAVLIAGEPGVGKSRLVYQFRERLAERPHTWLECMGSPYTKGSAFQPVIALVEQGLGFQAVDPAEEKTAKLERGLSLAGFSLPEAVPILSAFLGLPPPAGYTPLAMGPDLQRRKTLDMLVAWTLAIGARQPLVVLVEDLHWCDPSSLELVELLLEQSTTARVLLLATFRPEFQAPWPGRSHVTPLQINRLTRRQAEEIVTAVGGGLDVLPAETVETIVARADGVPLFVEELTKAVVEPGAGRDAYAIPATLADSLMARLDRLSAAKGVAQRAAVLGREFSYALVLATAGLEEAALRHGLKRLAEAEIVFVHGEPPAAIYTFKHALVREAAYESLLKTARRELHARVVRVMDRLPEHAAAEPEVVARHAEAAGLIDEAVSYFERAGVQSQSCSAHEEAITHLRKAITLLRGLPEGSARAAREASLEIVLGNSLTQVRGYAHAEAEAAYGRARALAEGGSDAVTLMAALAALATVHMNRGEMDLSIALAERVLATAKESGNSSVALHAHVIASAATSWQGRFTVSLAHAEQAIALYDASRDRVPWYGANNGVAALAWAGWNLGQLGRPDQSLARTRDAVALARTLAQPFSLAFALFYEVLVHSSRRDTTAERESVAELITLSESHGFPLWLGLGRAFRGHARVLAGEGPAALPEMSDGMALAAGTGSQNGAPALFLLLADAQRVAGQDAEALGAVEVGLAVAAETGQHFWDAELHILKGGLLLAADPGQSGEAEALFQRALEIARAQDARWQELRAATRVALLRREQGNPTEGRAILASVYASFTEGFDTRDLLEARELLDELGS